MLSCVIMAFRADEQAGDNRKRAIESFTKNLSSRDRASSEMDLDDIIRVLGPVVDTYPHWHPLITATGPRLRG